MNQRTGLDLGVNVGEHGAQCCVFFRNGVAIPAGRNHYSIRIRAAADNGLAESTSAMGNAELLVNDPGGTPILDGRCEFGINSKNAVWGGEFRPCDRGFDDFMTGALGPLTERGNGRVAIGLGDDGFHKLLAGAALIACLE